MRTAIAILLSATLAFVLVWYAAVQKDQNHEAVITGAVSYYASQEAAEAVAYKKNTSAKSAGKLMPGENVSVKSFSDTKSFLFIELERENGERVWVQYGAGVELAKPAA